MILIGCYFVDSRATDVMNDDLSRDFLKDEVELA